MQLICFVNAANMDGFAFKGLGKHADASVGFRRMLD